MAPSESARKELSNEWSCHNVSTILPFFGNFCVPRVNALQFQVLVRKVSLRRDYEENVYTISKSDWRTASNISPIENGICMSRQISTNRRQNVRNSIRNIACEVSELKDIYRSQAKANELAEKRRAAWGLVAIMFQRVSVVASVVVLAAVVTGIFLQLEFRTQD
jgi:hypothetical protein